MSHDTRTAPGAPEANDPTAVHERMVGVCEGSRRGTCVGGRGLCGSPDAAACGARADQGGSRILTACEKAAIEASVDRAIKECFTRNDGCNYPFGSLEERHWTACFVMKGGKL